MSEVEFLNEGQNSQSTFIQTIDRPRSLLARLLMYVHVVHDEHQANIILGSFVAVLFLGTTIIILHFGFDFWSTKPKPGYRLPPEITSSLPESIQRKINETRK